MFLSTRVYPVPIRFRDHGPWRRKTKMNESMPWWMRWISYCYILVVAVIRGTFVIVRWSFSNLVEQQQLGPGTICSGMAVKAAWRWITRAAPFLWTRVEFRNCHLFPAARNNTENQNSVDVLLRNNNIMYPPIQLSPCHSFRHSTLASPATTQQNTIQDHQGLLQVN